MSDPWRVNYAKCTTNNGDRIGVDRSGGFGLWLCFTCTANTHSISYLTPFAGTRKKTKEQSVLCGTQLAYKRSRFIIKFETKAGGKIEINWRGADAREWKTPTTFGFKIHYSG